METRIMNETVENLYKELGLSTEKVSQRLEKLMSVDSRYIKDLKINVSNTLAGKQLNKKETSLLALAVAINEKHEDLQTAFEKLAISNGANDAEVAEIISLTSLMNVNNIFYRFRHFVGKDFYHQSPAGIKMSIMMNPVLGKEFFELGSLVISALNGCEMCVTSHESAVLQHGSSQDRVLEAIRLSAVIKGLTTII